jgi:hypothetical protein
MVLIAIPICALVALLTFQAAGVCVSQQRYWTDAELIEVAVRDQASVVYHDLEGRRWRAMQIEGTPEAVALFLKTNPSCCSVDRSPDYRGILDVLFGWNAPEVQVSYERNRSDPHWSIEPYYTQWIAVSTCGEVRKHTKGWGSTKPGYP